MNDYTPQLHAYATFHGAVRAITSLFAEGFISKEKAVERLAALDVDLQAALKQAWALPLK